MTQTTTKPFDGIADSAELRIVSVEGGLTPDRSKPILGILNALLDEWCAGGKIRAGRAELLAGGSFLGIAWDSAGGELSGCSRDQVTHLISDFEKQLGTRMLSAPRFAAELDGKVRFLTAAEFREARSTGQIREDGRVFDHLVATVGELRSGKFETTVGESWYSRIS